MIRISDKSLVLRLENLFEEILNVSTDDSKVYLECRLELVKAEACRLNQPRYELELGGKLILILLTLEDPSFA